MTQNENEHSKSRLRKFKFVIIGLSFSTIVFAFFIIYFLVDNIQLSAGIEKLLVAIIQKSDCRQLAQFQSDNATMEVYGNLIHQTLLDNRC